MRKVLLSLVMALASVALTRAADPTVIFAEGFSAFTEGSESAPADVDISTYSSGVLSKTLSGWSGKYVYEAGGMLKLGDGGSLKTARYNMSANSGVVRITCRYRSLSEAGAVVKFSLGYSTSKTIFVSDDKWHTIQLVVGGGSSYSQVSIEPSLTFNGSLIDSLAVETSPEFFPAPDPYQPTNADGTSFTASWKRVSGAKAYILDVYAKATDGSKQYALYNDTVTATSKKVTGLDAGKQYYFAVRATNGTGVSDYSDEVRVVKAVKSLDAPVALEATNATSNSFTANWKPVAGAYAYELTVYRSTTMAEAGEVAMLSENFAGITSGSLEQVEFGKIQEYLDDYTSVPGWYAVNHAYAGGYLALSPFGTSSASLTTPYLDLSNNSGMFTADINMACGSYGQMASGDTLTVNLVNASGLVLESHEVVLGEGFKDYTLNFTEGSDNVALERGYSASHKVFISTFYVKQQVPAGYVLREIETVAKTEGTCHDVNTSFASETSVKYSYTVKAIAETVNSSAEITDIYSNASNEIAVSLPTGVESAVAAAASVTAKGGTIDVTVDKPVQVAVCDLSGRVLYRGIVLTGTTSIQFAAKGIVLVKVGEKTVKLTL